MNICSFNSPASVSSKSLAVIINKYNVLDRFSQELKERLNRDTDLRPFVCDGSPLECKIFIVGFNPATTKKNEFIDFWSEDLSFNKKRWLEQYVYERKQKSLKEGQKRHNEYSNTRSRIEWLRSSLKPEIPLETNIYHKSTKSINDLSINDRDIEMFCFLVTTIKPQILFLHGKDTKVAIEKLLSTTLQNDNFVECTFSGIPLKIIAKNHLSRGWSKESTIAFADRLLKELRP